MDNRNNSSLKDFNQSRDSLCSRNMETNSVCQEKKWEEYLKLMTDSAYHTDSLNGHVPPGIYGQFVSSENPSAAKHKLTTPSNACVYSTLMPKSTSEMPPAMASQQKSVPPAPSKPARPLRALTIDFLQTYNRINQHYYQHQGGPKRPVPKQPTDAARVGGGNENDAKFSYVLSVPSSSSGSSNNNNNNNSSKKLEKTLTPSRHQLVISNKMATQTQLDSDLHSKFKLGSNLQAGRYQIVSNIGAGTFGQVFQARDLHTNETVAIKVIRARSSFIRQAQDEIRILNRIRDIQRQHLTSENPTVFAGSMYIVKFRGSFFEHKHLCLVMDHMAGNLFQLLKNTQHRGVSLELTRKFAIQLCEALSFLGHPDVGIIHCDLKPENILMVNLKRSTIRVVDFGSSCYLTNRPFQYIQSRFYRSPEVIFGLEYGHAIDIWSLGCILVELHIGDPLFPGENELDQLLKIIEVFGMPPVQMIEASPKQELFFERLSVAELIRSAASAVNCHDDAELARHLPKDCVLSSVRCPETGLSKFAYRPRRVWTSPENVVFECKFTGARSRALANVVGVDTRGPVGQHASRPGHDLVDYQRYLDLIQNMLKFEPSERILPTQACLHQFFTAYTQVTVTRIAPMQAAPAPNLVLAQKADEQALASLPPGYVMAVHPDMLTTKSQQENMELDTHQSPMQHHEDEDMIQPQQAAQNNLGSAPAPPPALNKCRDMTMSVEQPRSEAMTPCVASICEEDVIRHNNHQHHHHNNHHHQPHADTPESVLGVLNSGLSASHSPILKIPPYQFSACARQPR